MVGAMAECIKFFCFSDSFKKSPHINIKKKKTVSQWKFFEKCGKLKTKQALVVRMSDF